MPYKILANCKSYSEWEVNEKGDITYCFHEFEGHDLLEYKIVESNDPCSDPIFEHESFEVVKAKLLELQELMPCGHNKQRCSKDVCIDDIPL